MMEVMGITENRYSGVPTMRREMQAFGLPPPEFVNRNGEFFRVSVSPGQDRGIGILEFHFTRRFQRYVEGEYRDRIPSFYCSYRVFSDEPWLVFLVSIERR